MTPLSHLRVILESHETFRNPAMAPTQAEIRLVELRNCFVNVPRSIVALLDNAKAVSSPVALFGHIAHTLLGCPECCRRATTQRSLVDCTNLKKAQWRFPTLCIRRMDWNGKHSKVRVNRRHNWKET